MSLRHFIQVDDLDQVCEFGGLLRAGGQIGELEQGNWFVQYCRRASMEKKKLVKMEKGGLP